MTLGPGRAEELRARINAYPPYVGAGIRVTRVAPDASEIRVEMPLTESNVNLVGTHFGGSLYAMVDPHLMILLVERLGPGYLVWDKAAHIDFVRPGKRTVRTSVRVTDEEVDAIARATADGSKHLPEWCLEVVDDDGEVVARVRKTLYVRRRRPTVPAVRYIVDDVDAALAFYRDHLGFSVDMHPAPGFAALSRDGFRLFLNAPGAGGGGRAGGDPRPGGWNRIQIEVDDLEAEIGRLEEAGVTFRGEAVEGKGGVQVLVEDPSGNPVELVERYGQGGAGS